MNILYLSHLSGASYAGPTYSVPKQIEAQSKIDNVFWYNATTQGKREWKELQYYHDKTEFSDESIRCLPEPFNHPDIIVVELFYNMTKSKLLKELIETNTPYVIIPRGELTKQAQKRKRLKKLAANILMCRRYAHKAAAIQYLTEQEFIDSGVKWNSRHIIIPNGIDMPCVVKYDFSIANIKCISIGRIEPYQKGLDLLIKACKLAEKELRNANCSIVICGPDKEGKSQALITLVNKLGLQDLISFHDAVYGEEKERMLLNSDVFIMPSRFEGHPMALIEALSYGLPCVASKGSNMSREVETYNAGWIADNDIQSLCTAIKSLIANHHILKKYSSNAIKLANNYNWASIAIETHRKYESLINE